MQLAGIGRVVFWEGGSLWLALITGLTQRHAHHAIQLSLPLTGQSQFQTDPGTWISYAGALIAPDVSHAFQAPGKVVANILFEPESAVGRGVLSQYPARGIKALPAGLAAELAAPLAEAYFGGADDERLIAVAKQAIASFAGLHRQTSPTDERVLDMIAEIRRRINEPLLLHRFATRAGLSSSRLRHLFVSETGISFRAFVLWERLNKALAIGFSGGTWTEAAYAANFADSAHLSRTCRRMFGLAPTGARVEELIAGGRLSA